MPTPRHVCRRSGTLREIVFFRIFTIPHTMVGVGLLLNLVTEPFFILLTPVRPAIVTEVTAHHSKKSGTSYQMKFRYADNPYQNPVNGSLSGTKLIAKAEYETLHRDAIIYLHTAGNGIYRRTIVVSSFSRYVANQFPLWICAVMWNGVMSFFFYQAWIVPLRKRGLVRKGQAVLGKITGKHIDRGKQSTYYITYIFTPAGTHKVTSGRNQITVVGQFELAREGQVTTILYHPECPSRNIAYEFGDFQATREWHLW